MHLYTSVFGFFITIICTTSVFIYIYIIKLILQQLSDDEVLASWRIQPKKNQPNLLQFSSQLPDIFRSKVGHHQFLHRFDAGRYLLLRLVKMTINRNEVKEGQVALLLGIPCYVCYDFQRVTCLAHFKSLLSQSIQNNGGEKKAKRTKLPKLQKKIPHPRSTSGLHTSFAGKTPSVKSWMARLES